MDVTDGEEGQDAENSLPIGASGAELVVSDATRSQLTEASRLVLDSAIREVVRRGEPMFAISVGPLLDEVIAVIVRDENDPHGRLIVFDETTLSDSVVACARGALMQSEVADRTPQRRTIVRLWRNGRYEASDGIRTANGQRDVLFASGIRGASERIRISSRDTPIVSIQRLGTVRLASPGNYSP